MLDSQQINAGERRMDKHHNYVTGGTHCLPLISPRVQRRKPYVYTITLIGYTYILTYIHTYIRPHIHTYILEELS